MKTPCCNSSLFSKTALILAGSIVSLVAVPSANAAVWDGGGADDLWTNSLNWGGSSPLPNDALVFGASPRLTPLNDLAPDLHFADITFGAAAGAYVVSGNRIALDGSVTNNSAALQTISLDLTLGTAHIFNAAAGDLAVGGVLDGAGGLTKTGNGTLTLSGANSFTGALTIAQGTLSTANWNNDNTNGPLGNSATPLTLGGATTIGTLRFTGAGSNFAPATIRALNLAVGGGKVQMVYAGGDRNANYVHINGDRITGGGGLTVDTFAGGATSRFIVIGSAAYTGPTVVAANGELQTNYSDTAIDGTPFGAGLNGLGSAVTVQGGGRLTFFSFGTSATVALGSLAGSGVVQGEGGGTHTFKIGGDNTSTTFTGVIQNNGGPVAITKVGSGTLTLAGANTFTGLVTINGGAISTANWNLSGTAGTWGATVNNAASPATTFIQMNGGRINYTGASAGGALRGVNLVSGNNTIDVIAGSTLDFAGGFNTFQSSGGNLIKEGGGTLQLGTFNVANQIFTGKVTINAGALEWFGAGSMPSPIARVPDFITINDGAKFQLSYPDAATRVSANVGFQVNGNAGIATSGSHTIPGVIAGAGGITKSGNGTLTLSGGNTYTGATNVDAGKLVFAVSQTLSSLTIGDGVTVEISGTGARRAVAVGTSTLIRTLDYSDTFTLGTGSRATLPVNQYPIGGGGFGAALAVENTYGNPARTWTDGKWSISNDANAVNGATLFPGGNGAGSATGMTQTGGGEVNFGIEYDLRGDFIVQFDAVQVADRVNIAIGNSRDTIFSNDGLSIFFRKNESTFPEIGLYNVGVGEANTGFDTGLADVDLDEWHNYAVRFNLPASQLTFWVDEIRLGILDLATFNGGAYLGALDAATNDTISVGNTGGDRTWTDNFQVGAADVPFANIVPVPEPGSAALLMLGSLAFGLRRRRG